MTSHWAIPPDDDDEMILLRAEWDYLKEREERLRRWEEPE